MNRRPLTATFSWFVLISLSAAAQAGPSVYTPLRDWQEPRIAVDSARPTPRDRAVITMRAGARPSFVGTQSRSVDILQDALLRKHPKLLRNSPQLARELIVRRFANNRPQLYGIMAEAVFVDRNPEWGYVKSPNAPQHDVYRWVSGRKSPETGQIKFHASRNPKTYARDMLADYRSERFFIPDDHVPATKAYLKELAERYSVAGDKARANTAWRN